MPLTVEQFTERLMSSGVMTDEQLRESLASLAAGSESPTDGEQLARKLVKQKKLTKFQAEQLYADKGKSLTLGNYVLLDKLGEGGMGMVLKAWHRRMERTVALKVIAPKVVKEPSALKRFQREVIAAAKLTHPNIVAAYDADEAKGTHFLVMEYVEGSDLSSWVKQHGPLPVEQAISCIIQAARGLAFAHDKGVVHRDIKPHNLLQDKEGIVKILDMGLARIDGGFGGSAEHADLTKSGAMMGTVDYMSPEQAMDSKHADARSDIYSLGCTLFYLVTGHVAFEADTVMKRLTAHQSAPPPSLVEQLRVQSPESKTGLSSVALDSGLSTLDTVFRRMVAKKPADRPQSMLQVIAELERCLTSGSATISVDSRPNLGTAPSAAGLRASPNNTSGVQASLSERDAETIVASSSDSNTGLSNDATVVLDSSVATSPATGTTASSNKSRKVMLISAAAVVVVLIAIVVAISGKSQKAIDEKLVANNPIPNAPSSEPPPTSSEVIEQAEPNVAPVDMALMFDGDDRVEIPSLTFDPQSSYTLEGFIASPVKADKGAGLAFGMPDQSYLSFTRLGDWRWVYQPQKRSGGVEIAIAGAAARPERTHLACVRDGQTHRLFVGGKPFHKVGEIPSPSAGTSPFLIGNEFRGVIDELRVSQVARYNADFTPPERFETDADTLALYHFDEGQGEQLLDSSGNNHHGKIVGAKWVRGDEKAIPAEALTFNGHRYLLVESFGTWAEAKAKADGMGGHLATINSQAERDWIQQSVLDAETKKGCPSMFLGGLYSNGTWTWITGEPFDPSLWLGPIDSAPDDGLVWLVTEASWISVPAKDIQARHVHLLVEWDTLGLSNGAAQSNIPARAVAPFDAQQARAHQEAWAKHLGTTVETTNSVGAKMILIPPGEFLMGSTDEQLAPVVKEVAAVHGQELADRIRKAEQPQHRVVLIKPFWMGATEVTIGQFRKFVEATKHQTYAEKIATDAKSWTFLKPGYAVTDDSPAAAVCWDDTNAYCRWLSQQEQATYRLPTDAEWEFACRAGTTTAYSCGDQLLDSHEWSILNSDAKAHPVATKKPNPFGLFDMHGNLSEWCQDLFEENWYAQSPTTDPVGPKPNLGLTYVLRGGNWDYNSFLRSAYRRGSTHNIFHYTIGFRVVREIGVQATPSATR